MSETSAYGFGFDGGTAVALGTFDGVHLGHIRVLDAAAAFKKQNLNTVALTFSAPPKGADKLCSEAKKEQLILKTGIDQVFTLDFDFVRELSPEEFFNNILLDSFNAKQIICGFNYRFGCGAKGDVKLLKRICDAAGIGLTVCNEEKIDGSTVSSTKIRELISQGNTLQASKLLGRYFELGEIVESGRHDGTRLGFATANFSISKEFVTPQDGVYATYTRIGDRLFPSVTNLGAQPTFDQKKRVCETHIIGFEDDIYGSYIEVGFFERIRDIEKFDTVEILKKQIQKDIQKATVIFGENQGKI